MKIHLNDEQKRQLNEDEYIEIIGEDGFSVYIELDSEKKFKYGEVNLHRIDNKANRNTKCFDADDLRRLTPMQVANPSYGRGKCCPKCWLHLNYQYKYCPECGQNLLWSE